MLTTVDAASCTPEWAKSTLKALGYVKAKRLSEYVSEEEIPYAMIALKVLKFDARKTFRYTPVRFIVCRGDKGKIGIKTVFAPRVSLPINLQLP